MKSSLLPEQHTSSNADSFVPAREVAAIDDRISALQEILKSTKDNLL
jgi:hypothetical protein